MLVLGANPVVSNGSMMTAPGFKRRLEELRQRGGRLVVVDPRRTETAAMADRHHFIRPGTDALLLDGAAAGDLRREPRGPRPPRRLTSTRLDRVREAVRDFSPERWRRPPGSTPPRFAPWRGTSPRSLGRVLRAHGRFDPGVRRSLPVAGQRAQHRHRQPRPSGRRDVHPTRRRPLRGDAPAVVTSAGGEPGPRAAGVRRRAAGGGAGRGDPDPRRGSDQGVGDGRREPGAVDAQRGPARPRPQGARIHGRRSTSTSTRRRGTPTSSCRRPRPSSTTTTISSSICSRSATWPATRRRCSSPGPRPATTGRSSTSSAGASTTIG